MSQTIYTLIISKCLSSHIIRTISLLFSRGFGLKITTHLPALSFLVEITWLSVESNKCTIFPNIGTPRFLHQSATNCYGIYFFRINVYKDHILALILWVYLSFCRIVANFLFGFRLAVYLYRSTIFDIRSFTAPPQLFSWEPPLSYGFTKSIQVICISKFIFLV